MNRETIEKELQAHLDTLKVISTHSHYRYDPDYQGIDALLHRSYLCCCHVQFPETDSERDEFVRVMRQNTYFYWLEKAVQKYYHIDEPLSAASWAHYDEVIRNANQTEETQRRILTEACKYEGILEDAYWNPGDNMGHPELFRPAFRINTFLYGYSTEAHDADGHNPFVLYGWNPDMSFDEYFEAVENKIVEMKNAGCVSLKSANAYDRGLDFKQTDRSVAEKCYKNPNATAEEQKGFQDYAFYAICRMAAKHDLPLEIHTGLARMIKTNAMQLQEVIAANPATKFDLFHASYPWIEDVIGLAYSYGNVYADLCWVPIISTSACERFLRELIETTDMNHILWGCDTPTAEESYGALLAMHKVMIKVFADAIEEGYMNLDEAKDYCEHILYSNAKNLFHM